MDTRYRFPPLRFEKAYANICAPINVATRSRIAVKI
jgi:hypothetical protein